jgi:predicted pyridoxine 5'-phosphate oxidase superfamily flavin-nucleotide-binding protein
MNDERKTVPIIETVEQLEAIYGHPNDASTVKVADRVTPLYRVLIEKSPFVALATAGRKAWTVRRAATCPDLFASTTTRRC